jgi:5S rRNA maturation endonuclease (ribonuclease M5)
MSRKNSNKWDSQAYTGLMTPSPQDLERAERMLINLSALYHYNNEDVPIIVEGKRDIKALRELGLQGKLIPLNNGMGLYEFCEGILERHSKVVLLMDWDNNGEHLFRELSTYLSGLWEPFGHIREGLKALCQKDIKDVESIPSLLFNLLGKKITLQEYEYLERLKGNR